MCKKKIFSRRSPLSTSHSHLINFADGSVIDGGCTNAAVTPLEGGGDHLAALASAEAHMTLSGNPDSFAIEDGDDGNEKETVFKSFKTGMARLLLFRYGILKTCRLKQNTYRWYSMFDI